MSMKNSADSRCLWVVMGLMVLIVSSQFAQVDCRTLKSRTAKDNAATTTRGGCKGGDGAEKAGGGMATFAVSSNYNSSSSTDRRPSMRSLAFRLASGPSKKGPGH
ncbi:hypothetical protein D8674_015314 [Pyrus ussuriensis x Pyrus communis]|uniref:Uncharacterized protein n=1 Tax=Pyrus ussuriensis x Pyrus communis TaxID=2448454 RepID=A0A5N5GV09_9ROSA|nr:hypothetical protein D8674_015314 [Pyrus ussuriensis x Pyrus communis]